MTSQPNNWGAAKLRDRPSCTPYGRKMPATRASPSMISGARSVELALVLLMTTALMTTALMTTALMPMEASRRAY